LHELHDGTCNVYEQKYCLTKQTYDSFEMKENELVKDMYSRLNLIVNKLNSIGLNKVNDADIVRKIISMLPQKEICKHHHHPLQHGGLEQHDPSHRHWQTCGV
jgi:tRNA A37 methylthiotransferase MiaB